MLYLHLFSKHSIRGYGEFYSELRLINVRNLMFANWFAHLQKCMSFHKATSSLFVSNILLLFLLQFLEKHYKTLKDLDQNKTHNYQRAIRHDLMVID